MNQYKKRIAKGKAQPKKTGEVNCMASESEFNVFAAAPKEPKAKQPAKVKKANFADGCRFFVSDVLMGAENQNIDPKPKIKELKEAWRALPKLVKEELVEHAAVDDGEAARKPKAGADSKKKDDGPRHNAGLKRRSVPVAQKSHKLSVSFAELMQMCRDKYQFCQCHLVDDETPQNVPAKKAAKRAGKCCRGANTYDDDDYATDDASTCQDEYSNIEMEEDGELPQPEEEGAGPSRGAARKAGRGAGKRKLAAAEEGAENVEKPKRRKPYQKSNVGHYTIDDEEAFEMLQSSAPDTEKCGGAKPAARRGECCSDANDEAMDAVLMEALGCEEGSEDEDLEMGGSRSKLKRQRKAHKSKSRDTFASDVSDDDNCAGD